MTNPLKGEGGAAGSGNFGRELQVGEQRTFHAKDKQGNIVKTFTLTRTTRDYVYDLCDAYNNARSDAALRMGHEWFVTPGGELRIGDSAVAHRNISKRIERDRESDRAIALRRSFEPTGDSR